MTKKENLPTFDLLMAKNFTHWLDISKSYNSYILDYLIAMFQENCGSAHNIT